MGAGSIQNVSFLCSFQQRLCWLLAGTAVREPHTCHERPWELVKLPVRTAVAVVVLGVKDKCEEGESRVVWLLTRLSISLRALCSVLKFQNN